jgi:hypothetical protein
VRAEVFRQAGGFPEQPLMERALGGIRTVRSSVTVSGRIRRAAACIGPCASRARRPVDLILERRLLHLRRELRPTQSFRSSSWIPSGFTADALCVGLLQSLLLPRYRRARPPPFHRHLRAS